MKNNLKLLEELVTEAVDRLEGLTEERDGFREEIDSLRQRLDALKREASRDDRKSEAQRAFRGQQAQALTLVQEALSELRAE